MPIRKVYNVSRIQSIGSVTNAGAVGIVPVKGSSSVDPVDPPVDPPSTFPPFDALVVCTDNTGIIGSGPFINLDSYCIGEVANLTNTTLINVNQPETVNELSNLTNTVLINEDQPETVDIV